MNTYDIFKRAKQHHNKKKEEAGDIGSRVHHWIEAYFKAKEGEEIQFDPDMAKPVTAFMSLYKSHRISPHVLDIEGVATPAIELRVWSRKGGGYAGTLDLVCYITDPKTGETELVVVDFKTGKGIYNDMPMQIASYRHAFEERFGIPTDRAGIIRLDKETGYPQLYLLTEQEYKASLRKFLCYCAGYHQDDYKRRA